MWTWSPSTSRPRASASSISARACDGGKAELRPVMAGADRLVRVGVDAEGHAHEHAADTGRGGELGLVGRVEHDRRALGPRFGEERLVLVVAVDDDLVAPEAGCARERQLARRGDVDPEPLLAEQSQDGHVRERLRSERDVAAADGGPE